MTPLLAWILAGGEGRRKDGGGGRKKQPLQPSVVQVLSGYRQTDTRRRGGCLSRNAPPVLGKSKATRSPGAAWTDSRNGRWWSGWWWCRLALHRLNSNLGASSSRLFAWKPQGLNWPQIEQRYRPSSVLRPPSAESLRWTETSANWLSPPFFPGRMHAVTLSHAVVKRARLPPWVRSVGRSQKGTAAAVVKKGEPVAKNLSIAFRSGEKRAVFFQTCCCRFKRALSEWS